jgi:hypothetical protein
MRDALTIINNDKLRKNYLNFKNVLMQYFENTIVMFILCSKQVEKLKLIPMARNIFNQLYSLFSKYII